MKYFDESREVKRQMAAAARSDARVAYRRPAPRAPNPNHSLTVAGWLVLLAGVVIWPLLLVSFILGIILAAKGSVGHGVAIMVLTFAAPLAGVAVLFA